MTKGEFGTAIEIFRVRRLADSALLAFENGFLSIEAGDRHATMRALGEWHGRAWFSSNLLKALAAVPPNEDPVVVTYDGVNLRNGPMTVNCEWQLVSRAFIKDAIKPGVLDLLAMARSAPRSEVHGTELSKKIDDARYRAWPRRSRRRRSWSRTLKSRRVICGLWRRNAFSSVSRLDLVTVSTALDTEALSRPAGRKGKSAR